MRLLNEHFSILKVDIVLVILLLVLVLLAIAMKYNQKWRYAAFLVVSAYVVCTVLNVAAFVAFMWYFALPIGLLLADLTARWVKKQLAIALEEEKKGGYALTKSRREVQIEQFLFHWDPVEQKRIQQFAKKPVTFQKGMFMSAVTAIGFLISVAVAIIG